MLRRFTLNLNGAIVAAICLFATTAAAKTEEWNDTQGTRFRGEPVEVLGPLALFHLSDKTARLEPWHLLTPADCVRFCEQVRTAPARVDDWAHAKGRVSQELLGHVQRVQNGHLVPADLKGRPEPEFLIVFFASSGQGKSWDMMGNDTPQRYARLQADYPGMVEALFFGLRHQKFEHDAMATSMNMPWLVADFRAEDGLNSIVRWAPRNDFGLIVLTRDGSAFLSSGGESQKAVGRTFDDLAKVLALLRPDNPLSWKDRVHYLQAIQPVAHATGRAGPVLVGDPLKVDALKEAGVLHFDATIEVAADGRVQRISFVNGEKDLKPDMAQTISRALLQAVFVPAMENGEFVDGVYAYQFGTPR